MVSIGTYNNTCGPWQDNSSVRTNRILLWICCFHLTLTNNSHKKKIIEIHILNSRFESYAIFLIFQLRNNNRPQISQNESYLITWIWLFSLVPNNENHKWHSITPINLHFLSNQTEREHLMTKNTEHTNAYNNERKIWNNKKQYKDYLESYIIIGLIWQLKRARDLLLQFN